MCSSLLTTSESNGILFDAIRDDEGNLIDNELEWGTCLADERDESYRSSMDMDKWRLVDVCDVVVHWFQQLGLMTSKVRNELKHLTQETFVIRDANSSTWLKDFADSYPQIFNTMFGPKWAYIRSQGL